MELLRKKAVKGACYESPSVDIIDVFAENTFCSGGSLSGKSDPEDPAGFEYGGELL